jgi:uncharacterized protein
MNIDQARIAVITQLAGRRGQLGRTALMKYCYFLQTLKRVPLGYSFSLYSYGPFDSDVLSDLDTAEALGAVKTHPVYYPGGYGYHIEAGQKADTAKRWGAEFLETYADQIDWVLAQFGSLNSAQLELASTIVYSDREASRKSEKLSVDDLAQRVHDVKPHFTRPQIVTLTTDLRGRKLLTSVQP